MEHFPLTILNEISNKKNTFQSGQSRGFAFVYYQNLQDAKCAKEQCSGMDIDGRRIRVDYSITSRAHTPTPGVYMGKSTRSMREESHSYRRRRTPSPPPYRERRRRHHRSRSRSYSYSPRKFHEKYRKQNRNHKVLYSRSLSLNRAWFTNFAFYVYWSGFILQLL